MNTIIISNKKPIVIGRQGENNVTTIRFAIDTLFPYITGATYGLVHQRHGDVAPHPVSTMAIGGYINWVVSSAELANAGSGVAQLTAYKDDAVAKSIIFTTITLNSMGMMAAPDPAQLYLDTVVKAGQEAVNAANEAKEALEDIGETVETALTEAKESGDFDGNRIYGGPLVTINRETVGGVEKVYVARGGLPDAKVGDYIIGHMSVGNTMYMFQVSHADNNYLDGLASSLFQITGPRGDDGYSPTVATTTIIGGHRVTITDADGDHTFDVMDGEDAPEVFWAVYNSTGIAELQTAYNAGKVCLCKYQGNIYVLSARSVNDFYFTCIPGNGTRLYRVSRMATSGWAGPFIRDLGTYSKPSGGIPESDLAADVKTSLGKAKTALQAVPSTYRTAAAQDAIDAGKADKITEVTISTAGAVTQALDAGKIYHFAGALSALTLTLNSPASGQIAQYHFDFSAGSTPPTLTLPQMVTMPDGFSVETNKRYEVDILNGYGAVISWTLS